LLSANPLVDTAEGFGMYCDAGSVIFLTSTQRVRGEE